MLAFVHLKIWMYEIPDNCRSVVIFCLMMYSVRKDSRFGSLSRVTILYSRVPVFLSMLADPRSTTACTTKTTTHLSFTATNAVQNSKNDAGSLSCLFTLCAAHYSKLPYTHYIYGGRTCSIAFLRFKERVSFFWVSFAFCSLRPIDMKRDTASAISAPSFRQLHETCNASPPIPFLQSYLNLRILHPIRFSIGVLLLTTSCIRRHVTCEFANNWHLLKYLHKHILKPYRKHMNKDISLQV